MNHSKGFSLVELAVAFTIIVLLLAGAMIPLSTQMDLRAIADTQRSMESIREAIVGFAQANGRLPCPAAGNSTAGTELVTAGSCNNNFGVVPWATLGVAETDFWGRRITYGVAPAFADAAAFTTWNTRLNAYTPPAGNLPQVVSSPNSLANQTPACDLAIAPTASSFALCTLGDIAVFTRGDATTTAATSGGALAAVIISHGKNGFGGWQTNGTQRQPIPPAGTDENANAFGTMQATPTGGYLNRAFWSRTPTRPTAGCADPIPGAPLNTAPACEFDDIAVTISSNALITRMVAAGRLP